LGAEWGDISARLARFAAEIQRRQAEIGTAHELVAKLEATLPLSRRREDDFQALSSQGFMASHAGQDRTRERIELERDLGTQRARLLEARATLQESENGRAAYLAETRRGLFDREAQARLRLQVARQDLAKASLREQLTTLTAPVSGTVQQLTANTLGGVVTEAQTLMVIVPDPTPGAPLVAEVMLENKDIGFVRAGHSAEVKLETFPFTRYGTVSAAVHLVTADAVFDDKRGAVFPARLLLHSDTLMVDGSPIRLLPGMNLSAEIKTGRRRVIDYLLSPLLQARQESLRER
jgi:hemolysin D